MKIKFFSFVFISICLSVFGQSQKNNYKVHVVGFYNLENFFDLEDTPEKNDKDFLPSGSYNWTKSKYDEKQIKMANIMGKLGSPITSQPPVAIGVCEVETISVLEDLVKQEPFKNYNYKAILIEGPDRRGIDVGFIYNADLLTIDKQSARELKIQKSYAGDNWEYATRNQLIIEATLENESVAFIVNHWPSRRSPSPYREAAGDLNRKIIDSLRQITPGLKTITMGDLNDDPVDKSLVKSLGTVGKKEKLNEKNYLYNPMWKMYKNGLGTLAYRDNWNLFDQIIVSKELVEDKEGLFFYKAEIKNFPELMNPEGRYKGYPYRTYAGGSYQAGYSDHFPVAIYLLKETK